MRVLVITDSIGSMTSAEAGATLAQGWPGAHVTPAGASGRGFGQAYADQLGAELITGMAAELPAWTASSGGTVAAGLVVDSGHDHDHGSIPYEQSSSALGEVVAAALRDGDKPERLVIDLAAAELSHDGGAGLLGALEASADVALDGGVAGLDGIGRIDLEQVRELLGAAELIGVVPAGQAERPLLGLRGLTSLRRGSTVDPERLLRTDATLERLARLLGVEDRPGAGACGGAALAILALGGRLTTGPELALEGGAHDRLELVVSGCDVFDFHDRGGEVVAAAARLAERSLCPAIVVGGEVLIGGREMRTIGIESAYPVRASAADAPVTAGIDAEELSAVVRRVARSWSW
ncbi:glycerate kinase [Microlunatus speluncae]|uniref:glycerate kinase n=1 Tax=Microlunatus speluncae TaxID=2594267 RepID=UPI00248354E3|nr:glycerate kinase [Microlunatus speluncae]